ncbi:hypothetical protein Noc_2219 [Nitrosococcus oceani ATCC 19707]|uniref:Uncharacterized protein n=2 Tax=Nitrosococcus oceani TaxID=1229 RepID=Q3J917_NITOC|nr:hypothetical protein Noc_2219 [Nitrosococcus oceani ATCC 19707]
MPVSMPFVQPSPGPPLERLDGQGPSAHPPGFRNASPRRGKSRTFPLLPAPYGPELHLIKILWRFIQYRWLLFSAFQSYANLKGALENRLANLMDVASAKKLA